MLKEVIQKIFYEFGLEFIFNINFKFIFYVLIFIVFIVFIYIYSWRKLTYYSQVMDMYVMELWQREENEISNSTVSESVKQIRLERLKNEYEEKIDKAKHKRDIIFKVIPFMKIIYRYKKSDKTPAYLLP